MIKSIVIATITSLLIISGNNVMAQAVKIVDIEATTASAIETINNNKTLSNTDKQKFITRLETLSNASKVKANKTPIDFELRYNRIASNYKGITKQTLPTLKEKEN